MNLDELKNEWTGLSQDAGPDFDPGKVQRMLRRRYRQALFRVLLPEVLFVLIYGYFVVLLLAFYEAFDTDFLATLGGVTIAVLIALPIFLENDRVGKLY
ncbi:MAG: hypothetical protein AAF597_00930 [Bacteroidota bacterium]